MKKTIATSSLLLASFGFAAAQGLYDIAPRISAQESSPLRYYVTANVGWDDNVTPTLGNDDDVIYASAYVGASLVNVTPTTTWEVYGQIGGLYYFDEPQAAGSDDFYAQARLGVNWSHRVSERLRFSSRNYVSHELEPDYDYGFSSDRQLKSYTRYSTDNAVGYRWTERLATYTGFRVDGISFDDDYDANNRLNYSIYNQFRYKTTEQTVWTLDYRYTKTLSDGTAGDSDNHFVLLGVEHRFSPNSVVALKGGVQLRDVDGGASSESPFVEAAFRSQVNEQLFVRAYARYGVEDYSTSFRGYTFDTQTVIRLGLTANYVVSQRLTLNAGATYISGEYADGRTAPGGIALPDQDYDLINLQVGFSLKVNDGVSLYGSYNWTDSTSDLGSRDYERNRANIGVRVDF